MPDAPAPARVLGPIDATCIVIGAIIGVGIFFNPAKMAALTQSGPLLLLAWAIGGAIALAGALTFAELGGMYHASGAQYQVLRDAYGPFPAFVFVFCNATAIQAGAAAVIASVCAENLMVVVGVADRSHPPSPGMVLALAAALILLTTAANLAGVRWGSRLQNFTVYAKLLTLAIITALAVVLGRADIAATPASPTATPHHPAAAVLSALVPALFAYGGWQHALWISGEVRDPARNLPRAIVGGVVVVIAVYLAANWAYLRLLGPDGVAASQTLAADAVGAVVPSLGGRVIAGAVALSALGVLNAQLLSGPRLIYGMARDGRFFPVFAGLSRRTATPAAAILLLGSTSFVLLLAAGKNGADYLVTGAVFIDSIFFCLTGAALIILRKRRPDAPRPVRVPLYPLVPGLFVLGEIGVLVGAYLDRATQRAAILGAAWIALAAILYFVRFRAPATGPSDC